MYWLRPPHHIDAETPFFSTKPTIKKLVGILGGIAIAGGSIYMAVRMRARCNTLLHYFAAHIHSRIHKNLNCIVPTFKKVYAAMYNACRRCVRLSNKLRNESLISIKKRLHNQRLIDLNDVSIGFNMNPISTYSFILLTMLC